VLFAKVVGSVGCGPELDDGSLGVTGQLEEVGAHRMEAMVVAELLTHAVEQCEFGGMSLGVSLGTPGVRRHLAS